jgi:polyisoprenyl-teichoic acid--peptidoglycan teichoic acid transferase
VANGDTTYTVYQAGRDEPVRRLTRGASAAVPATPPAEPLAALSHRRRSGGARAAVLWTLFAFAAVAAVVVFWLYGRQPLADFWAVLDLARTTGDVPSWAMVGAPVAAVVATAGVTAYLAFGRHRSLKVVGLVVVVAVLAAPGFALGWTNGTLGEMGDRSPEVVKTVEHAREKLQPPLPGKAVNILLLGADVRPDDPGRSDTMVLARLDPATKSITMLSFPRDLYVEIPGYGYNKMNAAYPYGGAALCVETVGQLTGLPVHHFIEVDFGGFWSVVGVLGGVYYPVDRRYYNPPGTGYLPIDLEPGYQLLWGHDALGLVRFRHDALGDFNRMRRQQSFLKELQRQSGRWNGDWRKVTKLLTAITKHTTTDLDSLKSLLPLASLALTLDTSNVHTVQLEGSNAMMDGLSYVVASPEQVQAAVAEFNDPEQAPVTKAAGVLARTAYDVRVFNGSGVAGVATSVAEQLTGQGFDAVAAGDADAYTYEASVVYAPQGMRNTAEQFVRLLAPAELRLVPRSAGQTDGITIVVGSSFDGTLDVPEADAEEPTLVATRGRYDEASWRAADAQTPLKLEMPGVWAPGLVYDEFRAYRFKTTTGRNSSAVVAVGRTPRSGYFSIQVMRWLRPPAIADPTTKKTIRGTTYLLFYAGSRLHMVAWRSGNALYWVLNTLDDELPVDFMMALATSFSPLDPEQPQPQASASP